MVRPDLGEKVNTWYGTNSPATPVWKHGDANNLTLEVRDQLRNFSYNESIPYHHAQHLSLCCQTSRLHKIQVPTLKKEKTFSFKFSKIYNRNKHCLTLVIFLNKIHPYRQISIKFLKDFEPII